MFQVVLPGIVKVEQLKNILGTDYVYIQSKAEPVGTPALVGAQAARRQHSERHGQAPEGGCSCGNSLSKKKRKSASLCSMLLLGCPQLVGR